MELHLILHYGQYESNATPTRPLAAYWGFGIADFGFGKDTPVFQSEIRNRQSAIRRGGEAGFTLIELILVIVLLGILAALTANLLATSLDQSRFDDTFKEMSDLSKAMVGNPDLVNAGVRSDFGFVGDMGGLPTSLTELLTQGALPSWTVYDTDLGTGTGWRGPYIEAKQDDSGTYLATLDGWGTAYTYNSGTGQVTSLGSDGAAGGSDFAADITVPETAQTTTGSVNGRVLDQVGNPVRSTTVTIRHPNPASLGNPTNTTAITDANGNFSFTSIPIGKHRIQLTVGTETLKRVVVVLPGQTVNVSLQASNDPTIPSSVSGPAATGAAPTQINLTWTAPMTNTDGSSLIDLAGYNIYRSTTAGFTPGAGNLVATIGLASSYVDQTISFGTTYYYHIRPVDKAGNIDTASTQVSAQGVNGTGSIVQVTSATVSQGNTTSVSMTILNKTTSSITIRSARVSWSGGTAVEYDQINFGGGGNEWTGSEASGSCAGNWNYTISAGVSTTLAIRFDDTVPGDTLIGTNNNIRISLYNANNCGGTDVSNGFTIL